MKKKPVIVYGASGYTGALVCEALRNHQIPFVAAGRSASRIEKAMSRVPGIETADYEIVEVDHNESALTELFSGAEVVCNTVGPFEMYGEVVVESALKAGIHYLDTTGEIPFMNFIRDKYDDAFKKIGKVVAPSTAYMFTMAEIAAQIVLETPGIDTLESVTSASGVPTEASTQTIVFSCRNAPNSYYLENRQRQKWPIGKGYEVSIPGQLATQLSHPWGGGTLPHIFERDARVRNCRQFSGFNDRGLMEKVIAMEVWFDTELKDLPPEEQEARFKALSGDMQPGMPPRENPLVHRCIDHVEGRGGNNNVSCTIRSVMCYYATGVIQASVANFLIYGGQKTSGFASPCQAVGHRELLGQLDNFGIIKVETKSGV